MKNKRLHIGFFLSVYFVISLFGVSVLARPVKAQLGASVVSDPTLYGIIKAQEVKDTFFKKLTGAAMGALVNSLSYYVRKVAFDTANFVATGDGGLNPLVYLEKVGEFSANAASDAVGELVGSLGEPFGLNLCQIPNPQININLKIGLRNLFPDIGPDGAPVGPKPKCSFQELRDNWGNINNILEERYGPGGSRFSAAFFSGSLSVRESDVGVALDAISQIDAARSRAQASADLERLIGQGVKDVVSPISGNITTPASQIRKELDSLTAAEQQRLNAQQVAGIYGSELSSLPLMAASVFLNTFANQMLKKVMTGLFEESRTGGGGFAENLTSFFASTLTNPRTAAQKAFSFITAPTLKQIDNYNIVSQLAADQIIDAGLEQAINRGNRGDSFLTIAEAIGENLLHGDWPLIPPDHYWNGSAQENCYLKAYCYSNLQKLRKARILPLGFELAALNSNPDKPWTLSEVVAGFDNCDESGSPTSDKPYCHLIDPNWIIKSPQARCGLEGVGPSLVDSNTPIRGEECMDLQTCLSENSDGSCNAWGYCTKEENVWRLGGEQCPNYYATCITYKNTSNGQTSSYLARTIDYGQCNIEAVGCTGYSTEKDDSGEWLNFIEPNGSLKAVGRSQMLYLNGDVETCPSSSAGCTAYYGAQRNPNTGLFALKDDEYIRNAADTIFLKTAPDYLGCYDTNPLTEVVIDRPQTVSEVLNNLPKTEACNKFAQACAPAEVGCSLYTSSNTEETIPGIIREENGCPSECAGYETFKQQQSNFEAEKFPLHFIPRLGDLCSAAAAGCDEFTNIEEAAGGGERLEYYNYIRFCEKPGTVAGKTFFSWEGSNREGYRLRNHKLKAIDAAETSYINSLSLALNAGDADEFEQGSPAYADNIQAALQENYDLCNAASYALLISDIFNPNAASADCRQFYDDAGNEYYRLMRETVIISNQCIRLRKSEPRLFTDSAISDAAACQNQGQGVWSDADGDGVNECNRCFGGGKYEGNTCVYQALPAESSQCSVVANGCRAYTGNTGNNVKLHIIADNFEGDPGEALSVWSTGAISAEALHTQEHSIRVNAAVADRTIPVGTIDVANSLYAGKWYELTFWARGAPQNLRVSFLQDADDDGSLDANTETFGYFTYSVADPSVPANLSIGNNWQEFKLGPTQFTGTGLNKEVFLRFQRIGAGADYYLDNISLAQIEDNIYLIKDSWKQTVTFGGVETRADAPATCFAAGENPNSSLPGFALGCSEYKDARQNKYYITGFAALCRQEAVSCEPLFQSNNTVGEILPKIYNAVCTGASGECTINFFGAVGVCTIPQGESKCYVPEMTLPLNDNGTPDDASDDTYRTLAEFTAPPNGDRVDLSTIFVPPESRVPIFLTNRQTYQCPAGDLGCTLAGKQDQVLPSQTDESFEYLDTYVKNNPEKYGDILCQQEQIGCNEYAAGANNYYFKDPRAIGNSLCVYKENVNGFDGWWKDGVGKCASSPGNYCRANNDCAAADCVDIGSVPCYEDYKKDGIWEIWSNKSVGYQGLVGVCESKFNACTELIDPADTSSASPEGKPYYRIFDDRLTANAGECNGQVSLKDGCVLFDKTDQPNKFYSSELTYEASNAAEPKYSFVNPISESGAGSPNDTNLILKVARDRECSEWLSCSEKVIQRDDSGAKQVLCSQYKACDAFKEGQRDECVSFVPVKAGETFLDGEIYTSRDVSWYGTDYSGYSLLNRHQIYSYEYFSFGGTAQFLGAVIPPASYLVDTCRPDPAVPGDDTNGSRCGTDAGGRCLAGKCVYPINNGPYRELAFVPGGTPEGDAQNREERKNMVKDGILPASCKVYPEADSPFPIQVADAVALDSTSKAGSKIKVNPDYEPDKLSRIDFSVSNKYYESANVCQTGENCSCDYVKYKYANFTDYYAPGANVEVPEGVCVGGDKDGQPCQKDINCQVEEDGEIISAGSCGRLKEIQTFLGLKGFCLEEDLSRPINGKAPFNQKQEYACQTWLPIQTSASSADLNNLDKSAGYDPDLDAVPGEASGELFCTATHRGGIVDPSFDSGIDFVNRLQDEVNDGSFDRQYVNRMFDSKLFRTNCLNYNSIDEDIITTNFLDSSIAQVIGAFGIEYLDETPYSRILCESAVNSGNVGLYITPSSPDDGGGIGLSGSKDTIEEWKPFIYRTLASFAWDRIGNNAALLRAEYHPNKDLVPPGNNYTNRFAPWVGGKPDDDDWEEAKGAFGTYKHTVSGADPTKYGGLYHYNGADKFVNEYSVRDMYFVPLVFKGNVRGVVPKVITDLANPNIAGEIDEWQTELLRLPIKELSKDESVFNGAISPLRGVAIDHGSPYISPYVDRVIINLPVTGGVNGSSKHVDEASYAAPVKTDGANFSNNQLLMWTYKVEKDKQPDLYWEASVQTKYVLAFFSNDSSIQYPYKASDPSVGEASGGVYDTDAPSFIESHLRSAAGFPERFIPEEPANDPFNDSVVDCQRGYVSGKRDGVPGNEPHYNPWWAVAVNFASDGKFLGYTTRWCRGFTTKTGETSNNNAALGAGIGFAVIADLSNQCEEIAQVHNSANLTEVKDLNKAWTNRVWSEAREANGSAREHPYYDYGVYGNIVRPIINRLFSRLPFGSLPLAGNLVTNLNSKELLKFSFEDRNIDGIPYTCNSVLLGIDILRSVLIGGAPSKDSCAFSWFLNYRDNDGSYHGDEVMAVLRYNDYEGARNALYSLFVKQFSRAILDNGAAIPRLKYDKIIESIDNFFDKSGEFYGRQEINRITRTAGEWVLDPAPAHYEAGTETVVLDKVEYLTPPTIVSINPMLCQEDGSGFILPGCVAGDFNNITVNNRTGFLKDYNNIDGLEPAEVASAEPHLAVGSFEATVKFFAFADDNRMPVRKVSVNWGDGQITNEGTTGYYKNRKPFCSQAADGDEVIPLCKTVFNENAIASGLTCQQSSHCPTGLTEGNPYNIVKGFLAEGVAPVDRTTECYSASRLTSAQFAATTFNTPRFGNAPRACDEEPFEFAHTYDCAAGIGTTNFSSLSQKTRDDLEALALAAGELIPGETIAGIAKVCKFKPGAQVVDNWGYCNGFCTDDESPDASPGSVYCYSRDVKNPQADGGECHWDDYNPYSSPLIILGSAMQKPWTAYKGEIIILETPVVKNP